MATRAPTQRQLWSPAARQAAADRMKARNADPAFKAKLSETMKARHADPAFKAKLSETMKARHADPAFKAKLAAVHADPAFSDRMKARKLGIADVIVPAWVPRDLVDDYLDLAVAFGEEKAASRVRRLKREMQAAAP